MKVLVINCGSSSIKYQLFRMPERELIATGIVERIGEDCSSLTHQHHELHVQRPVEAKNHEQAMAIILQLLVGDSEENIIDAVGHRVVHGGEEFTGSVIIDEAVVAAIERMAQLAPLHNPPNLTGIRAAVRALPNVPQVACFDTAFHATLPPVAYIYALPYELYSNLGVRRYGFHGTSHRYVTRRAAALLGRQQTEINCITCHLGNGSSITAVHQGQSIDTSMGLTPLEGVPMGTRCGDIDPAILFYLVQNGYEFAALNDLCNKESGLLGMSGSSNDMRTLIDEAATGHERAQLAIDVFCYRVKKYIGAYCAVLGRVDALVFTGGIGENAVVVREKICSGLTNQGIEMNFEQNRKLIGTEGRVDADSATAILVVPTDEEGAIAHDTYELVTQ